MQAFRARAHIRSDTVCCAFDLPHAFSKHQIMISVRNKKTADFCCLVQKTSLAIVSSNTVVTRWLVVCVGCYYVQQQQQRNDVITLSTMRTPNAVFGCTVFHFIFHMLKPEQRTTAPVIITEKSTNGKHTTAKFARVKVDKRKKVHMMVRRY